MSKTVYDEVWEEFIRGDHISRERRGEGVAVVLLHWLQDRQIIETVAELQRTVAKAAPLDPIPHDALHITVRYLGELTDQPRERSQFPPGRLPDLVEHLRTVLTGWGSFPVMLRRVNSFFSLPFIEAYDEGNVNRIRDAIAPGLRARGFFEYDYGPRGYLPHLSLGYYSQDGDGIATRKALKGLRKQEVGVINVEELTLIRAPWSSGMYHLKEVEEFDL